jgi:Ca2+-binding EF-hand superfamily protein
MEDVERAFAVFDKEGKGHIPTDELKHMMTKIGQRSSQPELNRGAPALHLPSAACLFPSPHL